MTHVRQILSILAVALLMCSCKLGHRYQRPDLHMPQEYAECAADTLGELRWWEVYGDTCLQALIRQALAYNKDILMSEARMDEMAARKRASISDFFPSLTGQAYSQRQGLNYGGENYSQEPEHGLKLSAIWELDLWGGKRWRHDKSKAEWLMSVELQHNIMVSVISDVAMDYYQLVALDSQLQLAQATLAARQQQVAADSMLLDSCSNMALAYKQDLVEMARYQAMIPDLERDIKLKENEISFLTGQYPGDIARARSMWCDALPDSLPATLSATLLERRPDIRAAEQHLIASNAAVGIAYTDRFPSFSLLAIGGLESDELKTILKSPMHLLSPSVNIPIFDLARLQAEYKSSQYEYNADVQDYEKTVLSAFREVSDAITAYNKCRQTYAYALQLLDYANSACLLAQSQYQQGQASHLDLIDAQRSYFDAQQAAIYSARDKQLTIVALYKSLGGGWHTD